MSLTTALSRPLSCPLLRQLQQSFTHQPLIHPHSVSLTFQKSFPLSLPFQFLAHPHLPCCLPHFYIPVWSTTNLIKPNYSSYKPVPLQLPKNINPGRGLQQVLSLLFSVPPPRGLFPPFLPSLLLRAPWSLPHCSAQMETNRTLLPVSLKEKKDN